MRIMKIAVPFVIVILFHLGIIASVVLIQGCGTSRPPDLPPAVVLPGGPDVDYSHVRPVRLPEVSTEVVPPGDRFDPLPVVSRPEPESYTVKKGDTLSEIASLHRVSVGDLVRLNNLARPDRLQVGQRLILPGGGAVVPPSAADDEVKPAAAAPKPATRTPIGRGEYIVQKGDSLWTIARRSGTTVAALQAANSMSGDRLRAGQKLLIPSPGVVSKPATTRRPRPTATPKPPKPAPTVDEVQEVNIENMSPDVIDAVERIPEPAESPRPEPAIRPATAVAADDAAAAPGGGETIHVVVEGEDLIQIAIDYNVTSTDIMQLNGLENRKVAVGTRLRIPVKK